MSDTIEKGTAYTETEIQSSIRDKNRLDFLQDYQCDLREWHGLWTAVTQRERLSENQPSAREAIDVAMANLKPQTIVKE